MQKYEGLSELIRTSELVLPQVDQPHPRPTLVMRLLKVRYRQYFLHQKFYKTPKTKYIIFSPRKLMHNAIKI